MEATLLLATIAQRFRIRLVEGRPVVPMPSITLRPRYGIWGRIEARATGEFPAAANAQTVVAD